MKVVVSSGRGSSLRETEVTVEGTATADTLRALYRPKMSIHRKLFKFTPPGQTQPVTLDGAKPLSAYGVKDGSVVTFKDLGAQIGYRTVFVVEYLGPIVFMLLYALQPSLIYGDAAKGKRNGGLTDVQALYVAMFVVHFVKRELETFFVHKFSRPTMPLSNLFKNSIYYWSFALFIGYILCHPQYTPPSHGNEKVMGVAWALMEVGNLAVHVQLSLMRTKDGDSARAVPRGFLFSLVTCPNYTFEVLGWLFYSIGCNIVMAYVFTLVGLLQMTDWARKKRRGYVAADPSVKRLKSIIPFVV